MWRRRMTIPVALLFVSQMWRRKEFGESLLMPLSITC
ncbi:hypothetical protein LINPERHAP2_LOCUS34989 [Linum perenne]